MFEWSRPYSGWIYVALAVGFAALILIARRIAISDRLRHWLLFVPRLAVLSLLLIVLLNPVWRKEHRLPAQPAQVHFLVDGSRSMALEQPQSRALQAQQAIQQTDASLSGTTDRPRVQLFRFGQVLASSADLSQLAPSDDASRLADALEQLPGRFSREAPRAVVVFSDGALDDADRLPELAEGFKRLNVPIHVFPVGDATIRGDVAIDELVLPPRVDAGVRAPIRGLLRGAGYEGERLVLQVKATGRPDLPPLATLPMTLSDKPQPFEMIVEANPEYGELLLEAPPLEGEVTERNNRVPFQLAQAPRKLKVIYMEGTGGQEYRWVRDALQEDKDIICLAMIADQQYVQRPRLVRVDDAYRGFPATREELLEYDCVICSDISLGAFTREQLDWTVELVAQRGGGFAMVGGITSFGAGGWDQTAWDQLIPIDMAGGSLGRGWLYYQFRVNVPADAQSHPIWRIVTDPAQNRRVLSLMPPFLGTNYMQRLKPAATVLGVSVEAIPQVGPMPIFACQPYGRGRTFAFAPDTTADWGRLFESQWGEGDNRYFRRFWRNVVRWLSENSAAGNKRLQAETDRVIYRAGQPIVVSARAYDEQLQATTDYQLIAQLRPLGSPVTPPAAKTPAPAGNLETSLVADGAGKSYRGQVEADSMEAGMDLVDGDAATAATREVEVIARHAGVEIARTSVKVQVLPDMHELLQPRAQPETLAKLALAAGGTVLGGADQLTALLQGMPSTPGDSVVTRQPLWDSPLVWFLILGLLAIEWSLRRRAGYA